MDHNTSAQVTLPTDREILITRDFAAPRDVVFDAWTKPEHVTHWWDPSRVPLALCEIDLRPNGAFRFVPAGDDGARHSFTGIYREIVPPSRLVFVTRSASGAESVGTLLFQQRDGGTRLTLTIACKSQQDRDALLRARVDTGTLRTLDNLNRYLQSTGTIKV